MLDVKNTTGIAGAGISISMDNNPHANVTTGENGSYDYDLFIPVIDEGDHTVGAAFIPEEQPLSQAASKTTMKVLRANTTISIEGPDVAYQDDFLNISGKLRTLKNRNVPASDIAVIFDTDLIGTAPVQNGNFSFSIRIAKNTSPGNHTVVTRFNGESLFLPSENSVPVDIRNKPVFYALGQKVAGSGYGVPLLGLGVAAVILIIFYLRKERAFLSWIDALAMAIKTRISKDKKTVAQIPPEPVEEIEIETI
ncbi:Uncharacterised protein [uncultured archaeon]|nr:Uncharacterised protein [uncultured archaeon]